MEFDPNFPENFTYLSGIFRENPCIKTETPTMVPLQQNSPHVPPPPNNNTLYQNNFHRLQPHHINGANGFSIEGTSSINPITMIPVPSLGNSLPYQASYANGSLRDLANAFYSMAFAPNNSQMEAMHAYLNNSQSLWDFSQKIPIQFGASSPPQIGAPLTPSLIYDASGSMPVNLRLQDELPSLTPIRNSHWNTDQKPIAVGRKPQRRTLRKRGKIQHKVTSMIKGQWSAEEDKVLTELVERFGLKKWSHIAKLLSGRIGKQCRERWYNHLRPNIRKDSWDEEEDKILIEAHRQVGNKWAEIARRLPGRSENTIKNHWNATKRRQNTKKQKKKKHTDSKETILQRYIKEVTAAEAAEKELKKSMKKMKIKSEGSDHQAPATRIQYNENSDGNLSCEDWGGLVQGNVGWNLQQNVASAGNGGNVPMMVNANEIGSGSVHVPMQLDNMVPEVQMK